MHGGVSELAEGVAGWEPAATEASQITMDSLLSTFERKKEQEDSLSSRANSDFFKLDEKDLARIFVQTMKPLAAKRRWNSLNGTVTLWCNEGLDGLTRCAVFFWQLRSKARLA